MTKTHTSIKNIKNNWRKVFRAGYCDLQYIMKYNEPQYYNSGVYGWNCDVYCDFSRDIAITTGYRNMAGKRIPDEILNKYTEIAKEILENTFSIPYAEIKVKLDENLENFYNELYNL